MRYQAEKFKIQNSKCRIDNSQFSILSAHSLYSLNSLIMLRRDNGGSSENYAFLVQCLNIEQEMHYVAIFYDVLFAFDADFACIATRLLRAK